MENIGNESVSDISHRLYPKMWSAGKALDMDYSLLVVGIGLTGNALSACVMLRKGMQRMTTTVYLLAIAVSDLIVNMFLLGRRLERQDLTIMTLWYCKLKMFFFYYSIHCSVAYITAMTFEKFLVIWFPLRAINWCTRRRAILTVLALSFLMLLIDGHNLFLRGLDYNSLDNRTECTSRKNVLLNPTSNYFLQKVYPWIDAAIYCYIPLVLLFILNVLIIHKYRQPTLARQCSGVVASRALQLTATSLLVSFTFMLCTLPIATLMIVEQLWIFDDDPLKLAVWNIIRKVSNSLMYTNHAVNFYIYCLSAKNFREELKLMFCCQELRRIKRWRTGTTSSTTASRSDSKSRTASTRVDDLEVEHISETGEETQPSTNIEDVDVTLEKSEHYHGRPQDIL